MRIASVMAVAAAVSLLATMGAAQTLTVKGPDGQQRQFTADQIAAMPHRSAQLAGEGGRPARAYEGVAVTDLLQVVGAPSGKALRGPALADVVIVKGSDGYRAAFGIAAMDPGMRQSVPILADRNEAGRLDAKEGPFRLVSPDDLRPARSVRGVVSIEVEPAP
ncbi:MAG: molybdopterin-binding oxidoreductase [Caulobacteraceae bacterium]|nr:molybdopterin-binding oxidoreductase [Caulobacteraceae bacterium]